MGSQQKLPGFALVILSVAGFLIVVLAWVAVVNESRVPKPTQVSAPEIPRRPAAIPTRVVRVHWSRPRVSLSCYEESELNYLKITGEKFWIEDALSVKDDIPGHIWVANGARIQMDIRPAFAAYPQSRRGRIMDGPEKYREVFFNIKLVR